MTAESDGAGISLGAETAKGVVAKFGMALVGFGGTLVFANVLQPDQYGRFFVLLSAVKVVELPVAGWADAAKKRFSETRANRSAVFGGQIAFFAAWFVAMSILAAVFSGLLEEYTGFENASVLFVLLLAAESLFLSLQKLIEARGRMGAATWADAIRSFVTFPAQLALVLSGWGASGLVYGLAVATFVSVPLSWRYVGTHPGVPTRTILGQQWEYARYSVVATFFGRVYERFDTLLLGVLIGPGAAGLYEVAMKLVMPASFVSEIASAGLMARVSDLHSRGQEFGADVGNVLSFASILAVPIFFGAAVMPEDIIVVLFQPSYAEAAPLLVGLALFQIVRSQSMVLSQTVYGLDRPDRNVLYSALAVSVNVVLGVVLTLVVGPLGVVIATIVAEAVGMVLCFHFLTRSRSLAQFTPRTILEQLVAGGAMAAVTLGVRQVVVTDTWLTLGAVVTVGAVVYFASLYGVSGQFRMAISSVFHDFVSA